MALVALACLARTAAPAPPARTVYLARNLGDEQLIALGAAVAARPDAVLLVESPGTAASLRQFLVAYAPDKLVPVEAWDGPVCPVWKHHAATRLVVCTAGQRELLLQAAHLAACQRAPLWVARPGEDSSALRAYVQKHGIREVARVGDDAPTPKGVKSVSLPHADDVEAATRRELGEARAVVVANPDDTAGDLGAMSALAPWLAATKHAALLLTNSKGTNVETLVEDAGKHKSLRHLDTLILLGNLRALPVWQRPNPIPGDKDPHIDMEPCTPTGKAPFSYATGRLFHDDRAVVPLMLARQRLVVAKAGPRRALVASNPGGGLPLLEAFSRNTQRELSNVGFEVTGLYGKALDGPVLRKAMPGHEVILWEGHHNTLVKEWGFLSWEEPLPNSFVFLQSCLALMPEKVQPLLTRGAVGVVGTSTRTYSGSGGAFSLAYFNGLVYDGQTLGGSLRQAKNFLLAYSMLKEKRLGDQASRLGANQRASWAFTLWGDPTYRLPVPRPPAESLAHVEHEVDGKDVVLHLPGATHTQVFSERFRVQMPPNGRLAGLIRKTDEEHNPVVPMVFAEVPLPTVRAGATPRLRSRLPANQWVFLWDARRRVGYVLVLPRSLDEGELRFRVETAPVRVVDRDR